MLIIIPLQIHLAVCPNLFSLVIDTFPDLNVDTRIYGLFLQIGSKV